MAVTIPLSAHLSWAEVLAGSGVTSPADLSPVIEASLRLTAMALFEPLRAAWGSPLLIVSGYRDAAANKAANGKPRSKHMEGLALDLVPSIGKSHLPALYDAIDLMQRDGRLPAGGLCLYVEADGITPRFLHADRRGVRARWETLQPVSKRWICVRNQFPGVA